MTNFKDLTSHFMKALKHAPVNLGLCALAGARMMTEAQLQQQGHTTLAKLVHYAPVMM